MKAFAYAEAFIFYDLLVSSVVTANTGDPVWFLKQYMIGKSYLKGIHTSPSEYYVITKDLKKE